MSYSVWNTNEIAEYTEEYRNVELGDGQNKRAWRVRGDCLVKNARGNRQYRRLREIKFDQEKWNTPPVLPTNDGVGWKISLTGNITIHPNVSVPKRRLVRIQNRCKRASSRNQPIKSSRSCNFLNNNVRCMQWHYIRYFNRVPIIKDA